MNIKAKDLLPSRCSLSINIYDARESIMFCQTEIYRLEADSPQQRQLRTIKRKVYFTSYFSPKKILRNLTSIYSRESCSHCSEIVSRDLE